MKHLFVFLYLLIFFSQSSTFAQDPVCYTLGGTGREGAVSGDLIQTADGGYLSVTRTNSFGVPLTSPYLVKLDVNMNLLWTKTISASGGTGASQLGIALAETPTGDIYVGADLQRGLFDFKDFYVLKLNALGDVIWTKTIGAPGQTFELITDITYTNDGGCILAGSADGYGAGEKDPYVVNLDANGVVEWTHVLGNATREGAARIIQTADGNYVYVGHRSPIVGISVPDLSIIVKLDDTGNLLFSKMIDSSTKDGAVNVVEDANGDLIVLATTKVSSGSSPVLYSIKGDGSAINWAKAYDSPALTEQVRSFTPTSDGGYAIVSQWVETNMVGGTRDIQFIKTNAAGDLELSAVYGTSMEEDVNSIVQTSDEGFLIVGFTDNGNDDDMYLIKADAQGNSCCLQDMNNTTQSAVTTSIQDITFAITTGGVENVPVIDAIGSGGVLIPCPPPIASFIPSFDTICAGDSILFTDNSIGGITSWNWSFPEGTPIDTAETEGPHKVAFNTPGNYNIRLEVSDDIQTDDTTIIITVEALQDAIFNYPSNTYCLTSANPIAVVTGVSGGIFSINSSGVINAITGEIDLVASGEGTYTVQYKTNGNCPDSTTFSITINDCSNPIADFEGIPTAICEGECVDFMDKSVPASSLGITSWSWTFSGADDLTSTDQNPTQICYSNAGTYDVSLMVTDADGTHDTTFLHYISVCEETIIDKCSISNVFIPSGISPNGDGVNDELCVFGAACIAEMELQLYDRWGNRVFETTDKSNCWKGYFKGKSLNNGVFAYYFKYTLVTGEVVEKNGNISIIK